MKKQTKTKLVATLMFLQAILTWSKEQTAIVLRHIDQTTAKGEVNTRVLFDRNNDGMPDMFLMLYGTDFALLPMLLKEYLTEKTAMTYDDSNLLTGTGLAALPIGDIMSINKTDILDLFPDAGIIFKAALHKRASAPRSELPRAPMAILSSKAALASAVVNTKRRGVLDGA